MSERLSSCSMPSWRPDLISSIRLMFIPDSRRAIVVVNPKLSSANGSSRVADATRSSSPQKSGWKWGRTRKVCRKAYILRAVEALLRRLQTDYIDLYQSHRDDPDTSLDETLQAYAQLMEQGKVRAIGASNYGAERLSYALALSSKASIAKGISASRRNKSLRSHG